MPITDPACPAPALFTDRYELTMVAAALADGTAERDCVFEVFARRLPRGCSRSCRTSASGTTS
jgi:nicotinate phosphoribosyltransferase